MAEDSTGESAEDAKASVDAVIHDNLVRLINLTSEFFDPKEVELQHKRLGMHGLIDIESEFNDTIITLLGEPDSECRKVIRELKKKYGNHHIAEAVLLLALLALRRVQRMQSLWRQYPSLSRGHVLTQAACVDAYLLTIDLGSIFDYRFPYEAFEEAGSSVFSPQESS